VEEHPSEAGASGFTKASASFFCDWECWGSDAAATSAGGKTTANHTNEEGVHRGIQTIAALRTPVIIISTINTSIIISISYRLYWLANAKPKIL
jgi:hypothetical protein